ncbi:hypothetical protein WEH80_14215 [Actinomycetes bacterium KLBMP 9759]
MRKLVERIADVALQRMVPKVDAGACVWVDDECCGISAPGARWLWRDCFMCSGVRRCDSCTKAKFNC